MTDSPELVITVVEIDPVAVHKNTVYDQTVVAQLQDGTEINLYDTTAIVENSKIGGKLDVSVRVLPLPSSDVRKASEEATGIYPPTNPSSEWSYNFVGEITDVDLGDNVVYLDIDTGVVSFDLDELDNDMRESIKSTEVTTGDRLYVLGRADLVGIN